MHSSRRRTFIKMGIGSGLLSLIPAVATARLSTPAEIEGPFYPLRAQKDLDFDLTRVEGRQGVAEGRKIIIQGRVVDTDDRPIEDVTIDLWQANAAGRYRHPRDTNRAPLDQNFQGWAIVPSGEDGGFRFVTVFPGAYPAAPDWIRPPHIHFKLSRAGYADLVTQMYFPAQVLNDTDLLLQQKSPDQRSRMIASRTTDQAEAYQFNLVLEKL